MTLCTFDVARVPFSTFGSWVSLSIPRDEEGLCFRNHHNGANSLFPLQPLVDGEVVKPQIVARPWCLVLSHGEGRIEVCFESTRTVRMRGQGLGLQFGGRNIAYSEGPNLAALNKPHTRRYQVEMLHGSIELRQLVPTQPVFPRIAVVSPAGDGCWELAIDEFWSTWRRPERASFDDCLASAKGAFDAFLATMPEARPQDNEARALAAYVNWSCTVEPCGLIQRPTLFMSKNWMSNVWSWDQCFNAMALSKGQPELALDQMLTLVDHQDEFGSYPDSVSDVKIHYNFSKPPVHGMAFKEMLTRMPRRPSEELMQAMYTSLSRQADWWMTHRRIEGGLLPHYLHGNDSGWDNSTMFASGVPLVAPDLAALLVVQMDVLAELAGEMGRDAAAAEWTSRADRLQEALLSELWRGDHFVARLGNDGSVVESQSLIPWLPIILGKRLPEDIRGLLKRGIEAHLTDWGLATERVNSPNYREHGYWRGPIWAPSTWIAVTGLDRAGFTELADTVSERFCRMCGKSGFPENFNALTGEPLCDPAYTWTSSVFLLLAERLSQRDHQETR
ncbi:amylo-alpha-1,6-glucosidase [Planctomycetota bacterium]